MSLKCDQILGCAVRLCGENFTELQNKQFLSTEDDSYKTLWEGHQAGIQTDRGKTFLLKRLRGKAYYAG